MRSCRNIAKAPLSDKEPDDILLCEPIEEIYYVPKGHAYVRLQKRDLHSDRGSTRHILFIQVFQSFSGNGIDMQYD